MQVSQTAANGFHKLSRRAKLNTAYIKSERDKYCPNTSTSRTQASSDVLIAFTLALLKRILYDSMTLPAEAVCLSPAIQLCTDVLEA
jgi:hypothetical protein